MLHHPNANIGDAVTQILRQWLQAWRPCFTARSWEHVLVLVMVKAWRHRQADAGHVDQVRAPAADK